MRHTYADTELARADLGFAPDGRPRAGPGGRACVAADTIGSCLMTPTRFGGSRLRDPRCSALAGAAGCATSGRGPVPPGTPQPDQFLFDRGNEALQKKKWLTAREYFKQVTETYTQSPFGPTPSSAIGDTYLGEGSTEALVLAIAEFQEFLSFYPTHRARRLRAVQARDGALPADAIAAARSDRDARRASASSRPSSRAIRTARSCRRCKAKLRETRDRLSTSEMEVGRFYFRIRWYPGAIDRLSVLLKEDPEFTGRDEVYFYLGESLIKVEPPGRGAAALREAGRRSSSRASTSRTRGSASTSSRTRRRQPSDGRQRRRPA